MGTTGLAFLAGLLSILSPCVLPILPLVLGAAISQSRWGPVALAAGLAVSFTGIGLFIATIGFSLGFDGPVFRSFGAIVMMTVGAVLIVPALQARLLVAGAPLATWGQRLFDTKPSSGGGEKGQFAIGLLLGTVWSPCVGPTLGAASLLAAQGKDLPQVALTMASFGIGASAPLLVFGLLSRSRLMAMRGGLLMAGQGMKMLLGCAFVTMGILVLTGLDKALEAQILDNAPLWLVNLTTRF